MKVLGRTIASAHHEVAGRSVRAARLRAGIAALVALAVVVTFNPGAPRASGNFKPTVTLETSTTQSAAHPDARITVDNTASDRDEDIKNITIQLPDGFWGSLDAAVQCKWNTTANNAVDGTCLPSAAIGTVTAEAQVQADSESPDSDAQISGNLYLSEADPANDATDPAGIVAVVDAKIGGVDLGRIVVHGRAIPVYKPLVGAAYVNLPPGTHGPILGIKTQFDELPRSVTDEHGRKVDFHMTKMTVDLKSDQVAPRKPLLTNPSRCNAITPYQISAVAGNYDATIQWPSSQTYTVTNCPDTVKGMSSSTVTLSNPTPGGETSAIVDFTMKEDAATARQVTTNFPSMLQLNSNALGSNSTDMCPATSAGGTGGGFAVQVFNPVNCPDQARFGTIKIWTPLLPQPVVGYAYFIDKTPTPDIGIWVDPSVDPANPHGVTISLVGKTSVNTVPTDASNCPTPFGPCAQELSAVFDGIPSAPISRVQLNTYRADRPLVGVSSKNVFSVAASYTQRCQRTSDATTSIYYHSWTTAGPTGDLDRAYGEIADPISVPGCDQPDPAFVVSPSSPIGIHTTDTTPTFEFGAGVTGNCTVDKIHIDEYVPCNSTFDASVPFDPKVALHHLFFIPDGGNEFVRAFVIDPPSHETTPPAVTFDSGPSGTTSDSTPSFTFHADEQSRFQCSVDDGAYLPCVGSSSTLASTGEHNISSAIFASDDDHTLRVRAADSFNNTGEPVTRTFKVEIPFDPTFDVAVSSSQARAHPSLDITITSKSHEDLDKLALSMPDGLFGSLRGATQCALAVANAGGCGPESQVGTVETEAVIDQSIARINGKAFMTVPWQLGDPAGLLVQVRAKIQNVDLGNILVPVRLMVRGQVKGIDSLAIDLPHQIDPAVSGNTYDGITQFDMRSIKLKLRDNQLGSQPLLTNPSSCSPGGFAATFTGSSASTKSASETFQATDCSALGFAPQLSMTLVDAKTGKPPTEATPVSPVSANMTADLTMAPSGSGIQSATLLLPKPVTVSVPQLPLICPVATYTSGGAESCPSASIVGDVTADSPLLVQPLTGKVYLVKSSDPKITLPRLLLALRGAINTDIFGDMRFENVSQIRTTFADLPDAPLTTFHINVNRVISTRSEACQYTDAQRVAMTTFNGYSGAMSSAAQSLPITCAGLGVGSFKNKRAKSKLSLALRAPTGTKFRKLEVKLPRGLKYVKTKFKKGFQISAGSKKLKTTCAKAAASNKLRTSLCRKYNQNVKLTFKDGSLRAKRGVKRPVITVVATDSVGRKYTFTVRCR